VIVGSLEQCWEQHKLRHLTTPRRRPVETPFGWLSEDFVSKNSPFADQACKLPQVLLVYTISSQRLHDLMKLVHQITDIDLSWVVLVDIETMSISWLRQDSNYLPPLREQKGAILRELVSCTHDDVDGCAEVPLMLLCIPVIEDMHSESSGGRRVVSGAPVLLIFSNIDHARRCCNPATRFRQSRNKLASFCAPTGEFCPKSSPSLCFSE
jgi:hypothetical protein